AFDQLDLCLHRRDLVAELASLLDQSLLLIVVFLLRNRLRDFILPLLDCLRLLNQALALVVDGDDAIDIRLDVAIAHVGLDGVEIVADELCVEHGCLPEWEPCGNVEADRNLSKKTALISGWVISSAVLPL